MYLPLGTGQCTKKKRNEQGEGGNEITWTSFHYCHLQRQRIELELGSLVRLLAVRHAAKPHVVVARTCVV
jgi:hypothetical protein